MTNGITNLVSPAVILQPGGPINPTVEFAHGEWHDLEVVLEANTPGVANGIAKTWIDGVQALNVSNVQYFGAGLLPQFSNWYLDPTFGGGVSPALNCTVQIAQWYYESAP